MENLTLLEDEHVEYLSKDIKLIVSPAHTFGTDALLLADFAAPRRKDIACDFGTGCGIIPMLWCRDGNCTKISAVEIQEKGYRQLCRSVDLNGLSQKLFPVHADLKALDTQFPKGQYDLVTMNPPYKAENAGIKSDKASEKIARHETLCKIEDITRAAASLLKFGGRLCLCIRPERMFEVMQAMQKQKIEPKRLRLVCALPETAPWLCLIEGKLGGKSGMKIEKNFFVYAQKDILSTEMLKVLGKYREEK